MLVTIFWKQHTPKHRTKEWNTWWVDGTKSLHVALEMVTHQFLCLLQCIHKLWWYVLRIQKKNYIRHTERNKTIQNQRLLNRNKFTSGPAGCLLSVTLWLWLDRNTVQNWTIFDFHLASLSEHNYWVNPLQCKAIVLHWTIWSWYTGHRWVGCNIWYRKEKTGPSLPYQM